MGLVHAATLSPTKRELVEAWLPTRPWARGQVIADKVAEYRLDDPAGEVGVETILWRSADDVLLQTPLTYRSAPLEGGEDYLICTAEHSVLGRRWIYDACGDPLWVATLTEAILTGGAQSQMVIEVDGAMVDVPPRMQVRGSGAPGASVPAIAMVDSVSDGPVTHVVAGPVEIALARVVGAPLDGDGTMTGTVTGTVTGTLTGTVGDDPTVHLLASVRRVS
jgi:Maltokinase N-terminal cap domain